MVKRNPRINETEKCLHCGRKVLNEMDLCPNCAHGLGVCAAHYCLQPPAPLMSFCADHQRTYYLYKESLDAKKKD